MERTLREKGITVMAAKKGPKKMTTAHKEALAQGREQGRAVRTYLTALEENKPRRGRRRTPQSITKRLAAIDAALPDADPLKRLQLTQERLNLQQELERADGKVDLAALEKEFVEAAGPYSSRKGISYAAWRELGVPAAVLSKAGISRSA